MQIKIKLNVDDFTKTYKKMKRRKLKKQKAPKMKNLKINNKVC